jgi:hypothetical protein
MKTLNWRAALHLAALIAILAAMAVAGTLECPL